MKLLKFLPIIGIIIFFYIIWSNEPLRIAQVFLNINYIYLIIAVAVNIFLIFLKGFKWNMIINYHDLSYPLKDSIKVWCIGLSASILTPGRFGDLIRVFYLKENEKNFGKRLSTVIIDRLFDIVSVLIFSIFGLVLISYWFNSYFVLIGFLLFFVILFFILVYFIINKKIVEFFARPVFNLFVPKKYKKKFKTSFNDFYESINGLKSKRQNLFIMMIFTMIIWIISVLQAYIIGLSLGLDISYLYMLVVISIVAIIELVPVSIMGLGTRDAFIIFSFSLVGISSQMAIIFSLLYLIVGYWLAGFLGFIFWFKKPIKLKI